MLRSELRQATAALNELNLTAEALDGLRQDTEDLQLEVSRSALVLWAVKKGSVGYSYHQNQEWFSPSALFPGLTPSSHVPLQRERVGQQRVVDDQRMRDLEVGLQEGESQDPDLCNCALDTIQSS
jgi:hypothetical protein